mgnify:CR=1 FL=1
MRRKKIIFINGSRSDFGLVQSVLKTFAASPEYNVVLLRIGHSLAFNEDFTTTLNNVQIHKIITDRCEVVKSLQIRGVTNISIPIFDHTKNAIAALTIPFVDRIIKRDELSIIQVTKLLKIYGKKLSSQMGYRSK